MLPPEFSPFQFLAFLLIPKKASTGVNLLLNSSISREEAFYLNIPKLLKAPLLPKKGWPKAGEVRITIISLNPKLKWSLYYFNHF